MNYYKQRLVCFDASQTFEEIDVWILFRKLIFLYLLSKFLLIDRVIKKCRFDTVQHQLLFFYVINGVKQGDISTPMLFNVYIDKLTISPLYYTGKWIRLILARPRKNKKNGRSSTYIAVIYHSNGIISINYRIFKEDRKLVYHGVSTRSRSSHFKLNFLRYC